MQCKKLNYLNFYWEVNYIYINIYIYILYIYICTYTESSDNVDISENKCQINYEEQNRSLNTKKVFIKYI